MFRFRTKLDRGRSTAKEMVVEQGGNNDAITEPTIVDEPTETTTVASDAVSVDEAAGALTELAGSNVGTKNKRPPKRAVGTPSRSIKQMKDSVVRSQAFAAASKVEIIQAMTNYETDKQIDNNPKSHTVLFSFDEIVPRPDKMAEGERHREVPMWTLLMPTILDTADFGRELEKLGKEMQAMKKAPAAGGKKKAPTAGGKKKAAAGGKKPKRDIDVTIVHGHEDYLASVYGPVEAKKAKKNVVYATV